jgi:hypothetical protein
MQMTTPITHDWLTTKECLRLLHCTYFSFRKMVAAEQIRRRDVGGYRRYWREDVERLASPPDAA